MHFEGQIRKMLTENGSPIQYYLNLENDFLAVNQQLNQSIKITYLHNQCLGCDLDKNIYRMGYCKSCFFTLPQANESVIRPELSQAHLGIETRDLAWEKSFELQPHIVYLAVSSGVKVGVTREKQLPTRWIDQGASYAIVFAKTTNRYEAGMIEVALKEHIADKTNYQRMLKNEVPAVDLLQIKSNLKPFIPKEQESFFVKDSTIHTFEFPVLSYPTKIKSLQLAKVKSYEGKLVGIKGQYCIFEDNTVWNVRNHEGFYVQIEVS